jgi:hypothetical protein
MTLAEWKALDDEGRAAAALTWNGYADGYWHALAASLAAELRDSLGAPSWVLDVQAGTHHGGSVVITVVTSFSPGEALPPLPSYYWAVPVIPTLYGKKPYPNYLSGGPRAT